MRPTRGNMEAKRQCGPSPADRLLGSRAASPLPVERKHSFSRGARLALLSFFSLCVIQLPVYAQDARALISDAQELREASPSALLATGQLHQREQPTIQLQIATDGTQLSFAPFVQSELISDLMEFVYTTLHPAGPQHRQMGNLGPLVPLSPNACVGEVNATHAFGRWVGDEQDAVCVEVGTGRILERRLPHRRLTFHYRNERSILPDSIEMYDSQRWLLALRDLTWSSLGERSHFEMEVPVSPPSNSAPSSDHSPSPNPRSLAGPAASPTQLNRPSAPAGGVEESRRRR